jgi:hypothetical protein
MPCIHWNPYGWGVSTVPPTLTCGNSLFRRTFHSSNCSAVSKASHRDATVRTSRFGKGFVVHCRGGENGGTNPSPRTHRRLLGACGRRFLRKEPPGSLKQGVWRNLHVSGTMSENVGKLIRMGFKERQSEGYWEQASLSLRMHCQRRRMLDRLVPRAEHDGPNPSARSE